MEIIERMKLPFKIIETGLRRNVNARDGYISLENGYLKCLIEYEAEEQQDGIWEEGYFHNVIVFDKEKIFSITVAKGKKSQKYFLEIRCGTDSLDIDFETYELCKEYFDKITNWKYGNN